MNTTSAPRHFNNISDFSSAELDALLDRAQYWHDALKTPGFKSDLLVGKILFTLFFENSTRTRTSFELAAKRLGAEIVNWDVKTSSMTKDESFLDTIQTLGAMSPDGIIIRHSEYNAPNFVAGHVACPVVNAGDSYRAHPSQALLDALTIRQCKGRLQGLTVAICGDVAHSRVAGSNFVFLSKMGVNVRLIAPNFLIPEKLPAPDIQTFTSLEEGLPGCDVIMMLRIQKERMKASQIPDDLTYFRDYGLTRARLALAKPDAIVMHPGPMNRGVEIDYDIPDDPQVSVILKQVANGVPARMAILEKTLT